MAAPSGLAAQLGFLAETTYGTPAGAVTRFIPIVDESVETSFEPLESAGIIAGARVLRSEQWTQGIFRHEGNVNLELTNRSLGLIFQHMMGTYTTANTTAPYTFTGTPGSLTGLGLTMQLGRPDIGGTVRPFTYAGTKIATWEIAVAANEIGTLGLGVIAQSVTTGTALASPIYTSPANPFKYGAGSFTLAGSSLCVRSARISGDNKLATDRTCIGSQNIAEPLESDLREYTGEVELEFPDLVHWERFIQGTEGALQLQLTSGPTSITVKANVRTDQATPQIPGRGLLVQTFSFKAVGTNSDASALSLIYTTTDSAA